MHQFFPCFLILLFFLVVCSASKELHSRRYDSSNLRVGHKKSSLNKYSTNGESAMEIMKEVRKSNPPKIKGSSHLIKTMREGRKLSEHGSDRQNAKPHEAESDTGEASLADSPRASIENQPVPDKETSDNDGLGVVDDIEEESNTVIVGATLGAAAGVGLLFGGGYLVYKKFRDKDEEDPGAAFFTETDDPHHL